MHFNTYLSVAAMTLGLTSALPQTQQQTTTAKRSPKPVQQANGVFVDERANQFANQKTFTFEGSSLPSGLYASNYPIGSETDYTPNNVRVQNGYLELFVPGGQTATPYSSGQIETTFSVKHASVRTVAILSEEAGVCNGMFFYKSDSQETDIEWLSDPSSQSVQGNKKLWFTNQDRNGDGQPSHKAFEAPSDATSAEHEYRIDWTDGLVQWFVDGQQIWESSEDVPNVGGAWLWNNWSNGDIGWTAGPPAGDAVFKIKSIDMYYNSA